MRNNLQKLGKVRGYLLFVLLGFFLGILIRFVFGKDLITDGIVLLSKDKIISQLSTMKSGNGLTTSYFISIWFEKIRDCTILLLYIGRAHV